jgi:hypothetical protein
MFFCSFRVEVEWVHQSNSYIPFVGTREDPGFNAQERTNKALTIVPFGNNCEADEVSPEVEAGVVSRLGSLQP